MADASMDVAELQKLKVADLKKLLKDKGLPQTGNKSQLLERLTKTEHDIEDVEEINDDVLDEFDEDDASELNTTLEDSALSQDEAVKPEAATVAATDAEEAEENVPKPPEQPASHIKPARIEAPPSTASKAVDSTQKLSERAKRFGMNAVQDKKTARADRFGTEQPADKKSDSEGTKITSPKQALTSVELDKLKKRADRFGSSVSEAHMQVDQSDKLKSRADRFGKAAAPEGDKATEVDRLKQRADRFGAVTSTKLSQKQDGDQLLKRKQRFGAVVGGGGGDTDVDAQKKMRAARFSAS